MNNSIYDTPTFALALYNDENLYVSAMLKETFPEIIIQNYEELESLLEDVYSAKVDCILYCVDQDSQEMLKVLNIFNEQLSFYEVPTICVAPSELVVDSFLTQYDNIDFLRLPLSLPKIRHKLRIYIKFFEKNSQLQRARFLADMELNKIQAIFNAHQNMIILYKENDVEMLNQELIRYFNISDIASLLHNSMYGFCLEEGTLHYKLMESKDNAMAWIEYFQSLEVDKRIVLMENTEGLKRSFSVSITKLSLDTEYTLVTFDDITNLYNQAKIFENYAHYDALTGLANRRKFDEDVVKYLKSHKRHHYDLSIMILDIDHFKNINDTFGHNEGDVILKLLASLLLEHVREEDLVSRWGGEEFIILLPFTSLKNAVVVAENLRTLVHNITLEDSSELSCSFGVAEYEEGVAIEEWIQRADKALYKAKESGRDRVECYPNE